MKNIWKLIIAVVVSEGAGIVGSLFTSPSISSGWYAGLIKPSWNPPSYLFAPVWTALFLLMGIAAYLVWKKGWNSKGVKTALAFFVIQLILNVFWSYLFFGQHNLGAAFWEIIVLWLFILLTIIYFAKVSGWAGRLLVPYILWVTFASYLTYSIVALNHPIF